jgi:ribonuclease-3
METDFHTLTSRIGHPFKDPDLLVLALTHPSCEVESGNNQRLEFLGDAVLDLIVAETIYREYPKIDEGALDRLRASIVNGKSLANKALQLEIGTYLQVSEAHREHHPEPSHAMLEDALEALIGAIYLDGGLESARRFILQLFAKTIAAADTSNLSKNPKGRLQELSQRQYEGAIPVYAPITEEGPDHDRQYTVSVSMNGEELGRGTGSSKKAAESEAAKAALKKIEA